MLSEGFEKERLDTDSEISTKTGTSTAAAAMLRTCLCEPLLMILLRSTCYLPSS